MTLVEFLRARLDATERALIEYRDHRDRGDHVNYEGQNPADYDEYDSCTRCLATAQATPYRDVAFGLADVDAKRRIVDEHQPGGAYVYRDDGTQACGTCGDYTVEWPCDTLKLLALPCADHPDYHPEWRP